MLKKVRTDELIEGMVVASDVFEAAIGTNIPFISRGVSLTGSYINSLKNRGIVYVLIETPEGYRGSPGEVYEIDSGNIKGNILFDGRIHIKGNLPPNLKIEAGERIIIEGEIGEGCTVTSATGGILIKGSVCGSKENPVNIMSSQNISIQSRAEDSVSFSDIKTSADMNISGGVRNSSISARGEIKIEGAACNSQVYSQSAIKLGNCGDEFGDPSVLMVKPFECRELSQELLKLDSALNAILKEKEKLQNIVDLIKKLGKDIEQLPKEKKNELAVGVKRFKEIEGEVLSIQTKKAEIKRAVGQYLETKRVAVFGNIFPRSKVTLGSSTLEITNKEASAAFFVKDLKVVSAPCSGRF